MAPLLPSISRTDRDTTTSRLPATWMSLNLTLQVRPLSQRSITRLQPRSLLHSEWNTDCGLVCHPSWRKRLRQPHEGLLLSLCLRPCLTAIQANLTRRNISLQLARKCNCEAQTSQSAGKQNLKCAKIQAELPTHLETALSRMF